MAMHRKLCFGHVEPASFFNVHHDVISFRDRHIKMAGCHLGLHVSDEGLGEDARSGTCGEVGPLQHLTLHRTTIHGSPFRR